MSPPGRCNQARKDKQALGLRPSFASLHQCLLVWKGEAKTVPCRKQARKDKQATKVSPLTFVACPADAGEKPLALMG